MAYGRRDGERGAAEGRCDLGDQFLEGVFLRAERTGEIAMETGSMTAGVTELVQRRPVPVDRLAIGLRRRHLHIVGRSEEHTSALQSLMRNSYAVCCLEKKTTNTHD